MHNFFWLTLLDRKTDHKKLKKIIYIWMIKNSKYKKGVWETSTLSARVISWILNVDIILNNCTFVVPQIFRLTVQSIPTPTFFISSPSPMNLSSE